MSFDGGRKGCVIVMWIVIYFVRSIAAALEVRKMLETEDILVMTRKKTADDDDVAFFDILVPQTEVEKAQELIIMNYSKD